MTEDITMHRASSRFLPLAPLAGALSLILAPAVAGGAEESAAVIPAVRIMVSNCNDSGAGSLRAAVAGAASGDIIDMRNLSCRRINLTSGAIMIPQNDLTLAGGGGMTVDANRTSQVFRHEGLGWLRIRGMTIARGLYQRRTNIFGGCIYSTGSIELWGSLVHWCRAEGTPAIGAWGGGIYARGDVRLIDSQVLGNTAAGSYSRGGGIATSGHLTAIRSRICGNHARFEGGGARAGRGVTINYTTISNNTGGALAMTPLRRGDNVIANSTISGNVARWSTMELNAGSGSIAIVNTTISGNTAGTYTLSLVGRERSIANSTIVSNRHTGAVFGGGFSCQRGTVYIWGPAGGQVHIDSTIITDSSCAGDPYYDISLDPRYEATLEGANNLITSSNMLLPPDTISADPRLAPLADNGGLTETHALLDDSPVIDMGNNAAGLAYDQRGTGFPRVKGAQADIGAYER
jgi:hypothetical protein